MRFTTQVATWCVALASFSLVAYSFTLSIAHNRLEARHAYASLRMEVDRFFGELERQKGNVSWITPQRFEELVGTAGNPACFHEVIGPGGELLLRSKNLNSQSLGSLPEGEGSLTLHGKTLWTFSRRSGGLTMRIARDASDEREENAQLTRIMLISLPLVLAGVGLAAWFVARQALKPVRQMAEAVEGITPARLSRRLPGTDRLDEIGRLSRAFNGTLERLMSNFQQATRFSADASHELKTPIAVIRAGLGELMHSPHLAPKDQEAVAELLEQAGRVTAITENLLILARADAGRLSVATKPVDVFALVTDLAADFEAIASPDSVKMELHTEGAGLVRADPEMLRQVLGNLIDNAMKFNVANGKVRIEAKPSGGEVSIRVGNTGIEIPAEHHARIFERFYRIEHTSMPRGTGLGLCIGRELARAMGGELVLLASRAGWTEFELTLPSAPPSIAGGGPR